MPSQLLVLMILSLLNQLNSLTSRLRNTQLLICHQCLHMTLNSLISPGGLVVSMKVRSDKEQVSLILKRFK